MATTSVSPAMPQSNAEHVFSLLSPDLGQAVPVVNMHFMDIREFRNFKTERGGGRRTLYEIKGAKSMHEPPGIKIIMDAIERVYSGNKMWVENWTNSTAPQIARDLVKCGTGGGEPTGPEAAGPAVWISRAADCPKTPEAYERFQKLWSNKDALRKEFPEFAQECEMYRKREFAQCEIWVKEARAMWPSPKERLNIGTKHRSAAKWIGSNAAQDPWMEPTAYGQESICPFCRKTMPTGASYCTSCNKVTDIIAHEETEAALAAQAAARRGNKPKPISAPVVAGQDNITQVHPQK